MTSSTVSSVRRKAVWVLFFFATNILSLALNLVVSSIVRRIGLIKTMVFTHVPASTTQAPIPLPSNLIIAMAMLAFRSTTNSKDQAPRQAFLAGAVLPTERTVVMGIVNAVKTLSQSLGPVVTGALAQRSKFRVAFVIAGGLKIVCNILMLAMPLGYRIQEERTEEQSTRQEVEREEPTDNSPPSKIEMKRYGTEPRVLRGVWQCHLTEACLPEKQARPKCRLWEGKIALHPNEGAAKVVRQSGSDGQDGCQNLQRFSRLHDAQLTVFSNGLI